VAAVSEAAVGVAAASEAVAAAVVVEEADTDRNGWTGVRTAG
jgi:hypothetical protein